ncbi:MAG: hypothetical protein ACRDE5_06340, partial [Ginsengibacter sp.]
IVSSGPYPLKKIDVFINDVYLGTSEAPFNFSFTPSQLENLESVNQIKIVGYDLVYNHNEVTSSFKIGQ